MTPEQAEELRDRYSERRRDWCEEIGWPLPLRRTAKRKPIPGVEDAADEEAG